MSISDALLAEIVGALHSAVHPQLTNKDAASDLFEAYILTIVIQAARVEGATVTYRGPDDKPTKQFIFRTSPGYIWSGTQPYTFAIIEFPNVEPLEAHLGVRVSGKSGVLHEFDVCVLRRSEALTCRRDHVHPRQAKVLIGVECKFYTTALSLILARSFLGLGADVTAKSMFFVTNTASRSVEKLLSARERKWGHRIVPGAAVEVERVRNEFQSVFKYFKAR